MTTPLDELLLADAKALLAYLTPAQPRLKRVIDRTPDGLKTLGSVILQVSRVQTLCAFERPVDLELFTPALQGSLDEISELKVVLQHFINTPALEDLNVELQGDDLAAAQSRFRDYLGSFLL